MRVTMTHGILFGMVLVVLTIGLFGCSEDTERNTVEPKEPIEPEPVIPKESPPSAEDIVQKPEEEEKPDEPEPPLVIPEEEEPIPMEPPAEEDLELEEPVIPEEPEPEEDPEPIEPVIPEEPEPEEPEEEDVFLDQARDRVKKVRQMVRNLRNKLKAEGKELKEILEGINKLRREEWGFDFVFVEEKLLPIHREENPHEAKGVFVVHPIEIEYLRLSFEFPNLEEDELLEKFRQSSKDGNISINPNNPKPDF